MNLSGQDIGEAVQGQSRLVRQNALRIGPQPCGNELLVLTGRKVHETVNPAANSNNASGFLVMSEQRWRVSGGRRLAGGKQTFLGGGDVVQCLPGRFCGNYSIHARNLNST
jgi:hypothetical protein